MSNTNSESGKERVKLEDLVAGMRLVFNHQAVHGVPEGGVLEIECDTSIIILDPDTTREYLYVLTDSGERLYFPAYEGKEGYLLDITREVVSPEIRACEDHGLILNRLDGISYYWSFPIDNLMFKGLMTNKRIMMVTGQTNAITDHEYPMHEDNVHLFLPSDGYVTKQELAERIVYLNSWGLKQAEYLSELTQDKRAKRFIRNMGYYLKAHNEYDALEMLILITRGTVEDINTYLKKCDTSEGIDPPRTFSIGESEPAYVQLFLDWAVSGYDDDFYTFCHAFPIHQTGNSGAIFLINALRRVSAMVFVHSESAQIARERELGYLDSLGF